MIDDEDSEEDTEMAMPAEPPYPGPDRKKGNTARGVFSPLFCGRMLPPIVCINLDFSGQICWGYITGNKVKGMVENVCLH